MKAIVNGINFIVDLFKTIFRIIEFIFNLIGMIITYISKIVSLEFQVISTLPTWILAPAIITLAFSVIFIILGRVGGRSA